MITVEDVAKAMVAPAMAKAAAHCCYIGDKREAFLDAIWEEAMPFAHAAIDTIAGADITEVDLTDHKATAAYLTALKLKVAELENELAGSGGLK